MLKVDLVVAHVMTCWILLLPKALQRMSCLGLLPVPPQSPPAIPPWLSPWARGHHPARDAQTFCSPETSLCVRPPLQSWTASFLARGRSICGVSIPDLPRPAAEVQRHVPLKAKQHRVRIFVILLCVLSKFAVPFAKRRRHFLCLF